ncbi:MAG: hypothetical protein GY944_02750 [bacterium]|nr:hypothetical protein [bacterium]
MRTFEYLVTDIRLIRDDGRRVDIAQAIQGNAVTLGEIDHLFKDVPAGRYVGIRFRWGVDPDVNENFYLLSSFDNLLWPPNLGGGYHNMRFEGDWTDTVPGDSSFALHSGYLRRCRDMMVSFEDPLCDQLESQGSFVVAVDGFALRLGEGKNWRIEVAIDVDRWMNGPEIDFREQWSDPTICHVATCTLAMGSMMNPETQSLLRRNGNDVFSLEAVERVR